MATVGRIVVEVDADTAKFARKLDNSSKKTKQWGANLKKYGIVAVRALAAAAVAGGIALVALTNRGVALGDKLAKTASKLGTTATALAGLRFAAEQTGVATNQLDLGIQRMTRRISEAAKGTGEAKGAIKELGLDAAKLAALPIDKQFLAIADAMEKVKGGSDRIRLGFKLFDSEGVALINTLGKGRAELEGFFKEAKSLGLYLDTQQTAIIEKAADSQNRLASSFKGLSLQLGAAFGNVITVAADGLTGFVKSMTDSVPAFAVFVEDIFGIETAIKDMSKAMIEARVELLTGRMKDAARAVANARAEVARGVTPGAKMALDNRLIDNLRTEHELRIEIQELSARRFALMVIATEAEEEGTAAINERLEEMVVNVRKMAELLPHAHIKLATDTRKATDAMRTFGNVIVNQFDFALERGAKFRDLIRNLIRDIATLAIRSAVLGALGSVAPKLFGVPGVPGFAQGGAFKVGGSGGTDSQLVQFRASPNEEVTITRPGQTGGGGGITIHNVMNLSVQSSGKPEDVERKFAAALAASQDQTIARITHMSRRGQLGGR